MKAEMDVTALVREEIVTDRKIGSIRVFTPITADGYRDETRAVVYMGETQIMTQMPKYEFRWVRLRYRPFPYFSF